MTETSTETQLKNRASKAPVYQAPSSLLLILRKPLIIFAHIVVFAAALILAFLVASNMQLKSDWLVGQYPLLLAFFIIIKLPVFALFKQYRGWWR
jgi:hypothetical protein